jgi:hypothetical protein
VARKTLDCVLSVRLPRKSVQKLDRLAAQSFRGRSGVMGILIDLAEVAPQRDLIMRHIPHVEESLPETANAVS